MPKLQEAINDLRDYMIRYNLKSGSVYVAAGTYVPTEATESSGGSMLNTSFKIYGGIHVYGGFNPNAPEAKPGDRKMVNGKKVSENWADQSGVGTISGSDIASQWELEYKTILSGNHSTSEVVFDFDTIRGRYNTTFPISSYHVVWFATNDKFPEGGVKEELHDHFKPLDNPASLDGCVITGGNAVTRSTTKREHTAYGGGVYMVGNSKISRCTIEKCNASLRGGGIYCDGGGEISFCYVHTCQATGVGVVQGYGGGVCIDHSGSMGHTHITSCAARCGGGLMISHVSGEYPTTGVEAIDTISNYSPFAVSSVINNNTANAEGGGVYLTEGGTINHCTVTNNNCIGLDVTYYGRRHGRTGGIYVRNCGMIFNSVFWGNTCAANNDIQFASVRQKTASGFETFVYHTAFMNHDISDWTGVRKEVVISLDKSNVPVKDKKGNYPCFFAPTAYTGVLYKSAPADYQGPRIWHISSYSALNRKGVQVTESMTGVSYWLKHAHSPYGVVSNPYDPVSTLGALVRRVDPMRCALIAPQGQEGRISSTPIPTLFIDPSTAGHFDEDDKYIEPAYVGNSWDNPIQILGDALAYYRNYIVEEPNKAIGKRAHYRLPSAWDEEGNPTDSADYDYVQILVKEGQLNTAGNGNYLGKEARTASIRVQSHMRLYGSYPAGLTGTSTVGRDPYEYITRITANIMSLTGEGFSLDNNTAHVVTFGNSEYAIVDGFKLADGNAHNLSTTQAVMAGGGVLVTNRTTDDAKRIDMVGNELRNSIISNCVAPRGAAVYVDGEFFWRQGFVRDRCFAELKMTNCVVRNNTVDFTHDSNENGVVVANGRAFLEVNHCDIVNNVGHPLKSNNYNATTPTVPLTHHGYVRVDNSLIFCNGETLLDHRKDLDGATVLSVSDDETEQYVFGTYNMFDADIANQPDGFFKSDYSIPTITGVLPSGYPSAANHLLTLSKTTLPADKHNQAIFTRSDPSLTSYPTFINPVRNVGHSATGDKALYGGRVFLRPTNANPCVNAASTTLYGGTNIPRTAIEDYEMTDSLRRDYGGHPDIGAIENISLPKAGAVIYVTPKGAGKMDGSSWGNAIAGNLVYQVGGSYVVDAVNADSAGQYITTKNNLYRGGYAVDYVWHTGTTEYIDNQTITQKRINLTYYEDGSYKTEEAGTTPLAEKTTSQTVTTSNTLTREKTEFIYGEKSGSSRGFYRTNLKDSQIASASCDNDGYKSTDIGNALNISNNRDEDYVSGLQFAVEKAAGINATRDSADRIQVWVGNGTYEDYKGFVMRDKVTVYGGFPVGKYNSPGMSERQALVSNDVPLSSKTSVAEEEKNKYETILQVIDQRPYVRNAPLFEDANAGAYTDKWAFNNDVILYKDKDFTESGNKTITTTTSVTIPVYYRRDTIPAGGYTEWYEVPGGIVEADVSSRITNPGFEKNIGVKNDFKNENWDATRAKYGWTDVTGFELGGSGLLHCAWIKNNSDINFYQEIDNLEPGLYRVSVQGFNKGKAVNNVKLFANGEERTLMDITATDETIGASLATYAGWFNKGRYNNNWVDVYVEETGHLRFGLKGEYTGTDGYTVFDNFKLERLSDGEDVTTSTTVMKADGYTEKAQSKEYSAFRKPVLYMPDVCMSTFWPGSCYEPGGSKITDNLSNARRQNVKKNSDGSYTVTPKPGTGYVKYEDAHWDGFTIRNGFLYNYFANRDGGAGVRMYEGGTLSHCVVKDNANYGAFRVRGGGGYCDGRTSQVVGSFFFNNINTSVLNNKDGKDSNGGGIYMLVGTCYNSLFANNLCWGKDARGAGIYIEQATFYNNTVAYNTCRAKDKTSINTSKGNGVHQYEGDGGATLNVFNTIIYGNTGPAIGSQKENLLTSFKNCYVQSKTTLSGTIVGKMVDCTLFNNTAATDANNPFDRLSYAPSENDFRLKNGSGCVNHGHIPAGMEDNFPSKDVAFADRVQDCQIDIGAYEYDASHSIRPDTTTHPGRAIFYVSLVPTGGDASACSPENAACKQKLQHILDAAGRYKYALMTESMYDKGSADSYVADQPNKHWSVEVWLDGSDDGSTSVDEVTDYYTPTRSTKHSIPNYNDNTIDYSFIIPHGIKVIGGFKDGYFHYDDVEGKYVDEFDPLNYRSVLLGDIVSSTGAEGRTYHVVTFTDDLFDTDGKVMGDGGQLAFLSTLPDAEAHRAVVQNLFIERGEANSPDEEDRIGAGAVVTSFAHVQNCVIINNEVSGNGGGLYLKPGALVSGCIIRNNKAETGGGIYVEEHPRHVVDSLAHIYATTICANTATASAGGMWFANTDVRVNSSVLWQNSANDNANVAGTFARSSDDTDYPFNFCGVESRRLEGQANIELSPRETEGVRWDRQDPFVDLNYYPIEMSSTLSRAGMTYTAWAAARVKYPTLDTLDIAGVCRAAWNRNGVERLFWWSDTLVVKHNDFIEMGARALNKNFEIQVDSAHVMRRLYVMHTDLLNSEAARALQDNTLDNDTANMYRQMGSCMLNPFHRLGDAFDYIIAARRANPAKYRNVRFEVFVEQGTYYPYHNAYNEQGQVRMNTFLIPEATTVIGGVNSRMEGHNYCQEGYRLAFDSTVIGNGADVPVRVKDKYDDITTYTLDYAPTDSIRKRDANHRAMRDNNLNSVIEPWEFERQTILSGNAVAGEDFTHVYHVITCHADSVHCGPQPIKYMHYDQVGDWRKAVLKDPIEMTDTANFVKECDLSILARTVELDGLQITGGYANHLDAADTIDHTYVSKTYFRGGGIFVDGNWTTFGSQYAKVPNMTDPAPYNIPIFIGNCIFNNNMAGNGGGLYSNGGIYMYGSFFTQNYSQGPMTELDQKFIPWTAGGCIATNAECDIGNSLFANNEARRGLYPIIVKSADSIPNADARQGFGGALSVASDARLRAINNHFVRNKAVAYSSIYNFQPNSHYKDRDSMQVAINCLFWGNEVFDVETLSELDYVVAPPTASEDTFAIKYKGSRAGVFLYDADAWAKYETLFSEYDALYKAHEASDSVFHKDVIDKLNELRAQGDKMEGMFFCAYRTGYGPTGMKPNKDGYLLTKAEQRAFVDPRMKPVMVGPDANMDIVEKYDTLFSYVYGNNNTIINRVNTATDGPNFKQPSFVAGIDGYMQNADWVQARLNITTDQGWGHHKQEVKRGIGYYLTKWTGSAHFATRELAEAALDTVTMGKPNKETDIYPVSGLPVATYSATQPAIPAMYNYLAARYSAYTGVANPPLPVLDQYYMSYTASHSNVEEAGMMNRISKNPKIGVEDVFIDLGIYEYQYVQLDIEGQEIDTMWVATKNRGSTPGDGLTWENPTTDLQYAIDMLMSSHNDHDKYVCFLGDEEQHFTPFHILDNRRAFVISSNSLAPLMPDSALADQDYGVSSLTFLGGYDFDVKDAPRDPEANPTIIMMPDAGDRSQLNQLFIIEDMTRQMLQVNWQGEYTSRDSVVIPIVFDGITFVNPYSTKDANSEEELGGLLNRKGGAAIYYRWQRRYESQGGVFTPNMDFALYPDSTLVDGVKVALPKLTLSNCIFMDNGARVANKKELSPAVRIDHGGGSTLVVNSLFHSNAGQPIDARQSVDPHRENNLSEVPNDVVVVNSTFALNGGHLTLQSANSEVHNSLIWLDDLANDTIVQLEIDTGRLVKKWDKEENKERGGIDGKVTNNAVWGCFTGAGATFDNESLSTDNANITSGPGFVLPFVTASTADQRRSRSFKLNPSVMTMNKADSTLYKSKVYFREYPDPDAGGPVRYWRRSNGFKSFFITSLAQDSDLACHPRVAGQKMERGAYECLATLQRVLYVIPTKESFLGGDGSNWEKAFGQGQLQNAIDAAAMYTYFNSSAENLESRKAYVYVRGTGSSTAAINIQARDGVSVYGSIPSSFNDTAVIIESEFKDSECQRFENYVRSVVPGVASPDNINPTRIHSVQVMGDEFQTGFLLDGFVIKNTGSTRKTSAVYLDNAHTAVRNCIITDTKDTVAPIADIRRGLLYNCIFFNDSASTFVKVGADGRVLNNTIIADREDVTLIDDTEATADAIVNNIALNTATTMPNTFAPYLTQSNTPYTLPAHLVRGGALTYQLHEHSANINAGTNILPSTFDTYVADSLICFWRDRDILGNPRRIGGTVDKGALETWRIEPNTVVEITSLTNDLLGDARIKAADDDHRSTAFKRNYGGNRYPHTGSVVYLMDSAVMTMQYETEDDFMELPSKMVPITLAPAYVLLKPGASFYGNGHNVQLSYVAAEKRFKNQRYSMTAFPFRYNVNESTVTKYVPAKDSLAFLLSPITFNTYQYSGAARSQKDYVFQTTNSSLWLPVDTVNRSATDGYLMDFESTIADTVLRFTSYAPSGQYVYTEEDVDKSIYLTQYDHCVAGTGSDLNFTRQEDMGWNMKGLPWLVSNYRTDTILEAENYLRQMFIPHVFYHMDGAGQDVSSGDQMLTARSWDKGATMSMGNAFFTQTATTSDREEVIFHLPYYGMNEKASRPIVRLAARRSAMSDVLTVIPDNEAEKQVSYTYGRDGMKWLTNDSVAQMYLMDSKRQSRISLLDAAPTEMDIPLGVQIPAAMDKTTFIFSLPERKAFESYPYVWLIDYQLKRTINLLDADYEATLDAGTHNNRFALRIGGFPITDIKGKREYIVYTFGGMLYVRGLVPGDRITVYAATGQIITSDIASDTEWSTPLSYQASYVVLVNDTPTKVVNL